MSAAELRLGERPTDEGPVFRKAVLVELFALWLGVLLLIRGVVMAQRGLGLPDWVLSVVPLLFIYGPVALCHWRKADSWAYRLSIPAFRDTAAWGSAAGLAGKTVLLLGLPFFVGYHVYQTALFGHHPGAGAPKELLTLALYQVFFVAIPEEFFYRGYFQTRLNEAFARRWLIFGVAMGPGALIADAFFAFGHSVVQVQWWHFATFFPGLLFAWMRERTGGVTAGALFHAACNVGVICLDSWYGIR
jgi:membrane protease YdiL (CAAX protease family)